MSSPNSKRNRRGGTAHRASAATRPSNADGAPAKGVTATPASPKPSTPPPRGPSRTQQPPTSGYIAESSARAAVGLPPPPPPVGNRRSRRSHQRGLRHLDYLEYLPEPFLEYMAARLALQAELEASARSNIDPFRERYFGRTPNTFNPATSTPSLEEAHAFITEVDDSPQSFPIADSWRESNIYDLAPETPSDPVAPPVGETTQAPALEVTTIGREEPREPAQDIAAAPERSGPSAPAYAPAGMPIYEMNVGGQTSGGVPGSGFNRDAETRSRASSRQHVSPEPTASRVGHSDPMPNPAISGRYQEGRRERLPKPGPEHEDSPKTKQFNDHLKWGVISGLAGVLAISLFLLRK